MIIKKEPLFWSLDLEMEQPSDEIISVGTAFEYPTGTVIKNFLITPSKPLSPFIQELTGLKDDMFDWNKTRKECFIEFYNEYYKFTAINNPGVKPQLNPVTWGQGDLHLLRKQMNEVIFTNVELPKRIIDVKTLLWFDKIVKGEYNSSRMSLDSGLKYMGLKFYGNKHNSADDACNTLLLFRQFLYYKVKLKNHLESIPDLM